MREAKLFQVLYLGIKYISAPLTFWGAKQEEELWWICCKCKWKLFCDSCVLFSSDLVNISSYCSVFNIHVQVCVDRQTLTVASDTVDFMLSKNLAVEPALLQILLHKLGKQNLWLRAREVFRREYWFAELKLKSPNTRPAPAVRTLLYVLTRFSECGILSRCIGSTWLHDADCPLSIGRGGASSHSRDVHHCQRIGHSPPDRYRHLLPQHHPEKVIRVWTRVRGCIMWLIYWFFFYFYDTALSSSTRTQSGESEYISAGSRILSAACIPQPNLTIQYTAVNSSQEQVFTLDISSARSWLRHNHLWANEVWAHWAELPSVLTHYVPQTAGVGEIGKKQMVGFASLLVRTFVTPMVMFQFNCTLFWQILVYVNSLLFPRVLLTVLPITNIRLFVEQQAQVIKFCSEHVNNLSVCVYIDAVCLYISV